MLVNSSGMPPFTRRALACLAALSLTVTFAPRAGAAAPVEGVPRFDHVVVLVEENEAAATTFAPGSPATYLKGLRSKGAFLKKNVPALAAYLAAHNGLLIVNFDEGGTPTGPQDAVANSAEYSCPTCAGLGLGGRTGAILVSPRLKQGLVANTGYDHYSLLRTLEDAFGITEYLGGAAQAAPFTEAFAGSR